MRQLLNYLRQFAASAEQNDETCREQRTAEIQALLDEIAACPHARRKRHRAASEF